jgi:hypothetical protein
MSAHAIELKQVTGRLAKPLRRFGAAGTLFFLIKGLLWLIVPLVLAGGF